MSVLDTAQLPVFAAGKVTVAGGAITGHRTTGKVTATYTSAGNVNLVTTDELAVGETVINISLLNAGQGHVDDAASTVTSKKVLTFAADGTTATDKSFNYVIYSLPPSQ